MICFFLHSPALFNEDLRILQKYWEGRNIVWKISEIKGMGLQDLRLTIQEQQLHVFAMIWLTQSSACFFWHYDIYTYYLISV